MGTQIFAVDNRLEIHSLKIKLMHQLWTLCHEPTYASRKEYCVLLGNGELFRIQNGEEVSVELVAPFEQWRLRSLPPLPPILRRDDDLGGIVADCQIALRLRNITSQVLKEIAL